MALPARLSSTWRSRFGSPISWAGSSAAARRGDLEPLGMGPRRQQLGGALDELDRVERLVVERHPPGLDLGHVEDLVDDRQQRPRRGVRGLGIALLLGAEAGLEQQPGHADDAVHRRADLVAHGGQELGLGAVGILRLRRLARTGVHRGLERCDAGLRGAPGIDDEIDRIAHQPDEGGHDHHGAADAGERDRQAEAGHQHHAEAGEPDAVAGRARSASASPSSDSGSRLRLAAWAARPCGG
jgi:hypothetical protein